MIVWVLISLGGVLVPASAQSRAAPGEPPVFALAAVSPAEIEKAKAAAGIREPVGIHRALPAAVVKKGRWTKLKDGGSLWRLAIRSPGAAGLRLHFREFDAGEGSVWVRAGKPDQPDGGGPYSGKGPDAAGEFWSGVTEGETTIVEYKPGPRMPRGKPPFRLVEVSHLWRAVP